VNTNHNTEVQPMSVEQLVVLILVIILILFLLSRL
jgi:hypothetical protein